MDNKNISTESERFRATFNTHAEKATESLEEMRLMVYDIEKQKAIGYDYIEPMRRINDILSELVRGIYVVMSEFEKEHGNKRATN